MTTNCGGWDEAFSFGSTFILDSPDAILVDSHFASCLQERIQGEQRGHSPRPRLKGMGCRATVVIVMGVAFGQVLT